MTKRSILWRDAVEAYSETWERIRNEAFKLGPGMTPAGIPAMLAAEQATEKVQRCNRVLTKLLGST
jgi:hypothetical protein